MRSQILTVVLVIVITLSTTGLGLAQRTTATFAGVVVTAWSVHRSPPSARDDYATTWRASRN